MAKKETAQEKTVNPAEAKAAALKKALEVINKKGTLVMRLGDMANLNIPSIPTGILPLDLALGIGGLPRGRIIEIYGPESSGKTTVALHIIASVQKTGGTAAFIDAEHALDPVYAKRLGVNVDELLIAQPDSGEQGLEIADGLISSGAIDVIVIDSVAALVPKSELDGEMGAASVGLHARMMSKAMRKLAGTISKTDTIAIFINQLREKVGVMFGNPEITTGGRALKFYATIRLEVRRGEAILEDKKLIGNKVKIKVAKNKVAPPFKLAEFDLIYGSGYDKVAGILDLAATMGVITKKGSHYYSDDEKIKLGNGRDVAKQFLCDNPDFYADVEQKVYALLKKGVRPTESEDTAETQNKAEAEAAADELKEVVVEKADYLPTSGEEDDT